MDWMSGAYIASSSRLPSYCPLVTLLLLLLLLLLIIVTGMVSVLHQICSLMCIGMLVLEIGLEEFLYRPTIWELV